MFKVFVITAILLVTIDARKKSSKCVKENTNYPGADIIAFEDVQNIWHCVMQCAITDRCKSVSYTVETRKCWLKNKDKGDEEVVDKGTQSASLSCYAEQNSNRFMDCVRRDTAYMGSDIERVDNVESINDCFAKCLPHDRCVSVTYQPATKRCWLKEIINGQNLETDNSVSSVNVACLAMFSI